MINKKDFDCIDDVNKALELIYIIDNLIKQIKRTKDQKKIKKIKKKYYDVWYDFVFAIAGLEITLKNYNKYMDYIDEITKEKEENNEK